ncbi:MAG: type II secretion system protein J [bacterium]
MERGKGFTLIELMIVVALLGILAVGAAVFFTNTFDIWHQSRRQISVQQNARVAMGEMSRNIRQCADPGAIVPGVGSSSTAIDFVLFDAGGNKNITFYRGDNVTKAPSATGTALYRVVNGVTSTLITDNLQSIWFVHESQYVVHIATLTLTSGGQTITLDKRIRLRNP